jgi:hypothetical protein
LPGKSSPQVLGAAIVMRGELEETQVIFPISVSCPIVLKGIFQVFTAVLQAKVMA